MALNEKKTKLFFIDDKINYMRHRPILYFVTLSSPRVEAIWKRNVRAYWFEIEYTWFFFSQAQSFKIGWFLNWLLLSSCVADIASCISCAKHECKFVWVNSKYTQFSINMSKIWPFDDVLDKIHFIVIFSMKWIWIP